LIFFWQLNLFVIQRILSSMTKNIVHFVMLTLGLGTVMACAQSSPAVPKLETDEQKTLYMLGVLLGKNIKQFALTPEELTFVKAGLTDAVTDAKPQVEVNTYGPKVNELAQKRAAAGAEETKKKGQEFADKVAKEKDATRTATGIVIRVIKPGSGPSPAASDVVKVHYEGKLIDGTIFDSSIKRGEPAEFPLSGVVPCWTEALQKMKKGEKSQIVCPAAVAYGDRGAPPDIGPGATLSFEVELLDFHKP
jgi:FKBP-type peptidyl-prolyl cis-trans isomerase FkpA